MESRIDQALERHHMGYNCAQSVACTYCDLFGFDEETAFKMTEGFGLGMGGMQATCGALSGAMAVAGMLNSKGLGQYVSKKDTYALGRRMTGEFADAVGSIVCREIKGVDTGVILKSCDGCVEEGCRLVEKLLEEKGL